MDKANEMNIYQKLAILQDRIKVQKNNVNDFAKFKYRTIQDIFSELKPALKELNLIITFCGGKLDEDKYTLGIMIIDINRPENKIDETGEIYIDRDKSKMDLSQKVLSAKTFLKKSLLEDLLLISEDDDPDSHNNINNNSNGKSYNEKQKQQNKPKPNLRQELETKIQNILFLAGNKNLKNVPALLEKHSEFTGKDGKTVAGEKDIKKLTDGRIQATYGKLQAVYPDIYTAVKEAFEERKREV